jgi:hypothetical protein
MRREITAINAPPPCRNKHHATTHPPVPCSTPPRIALMPCHVHVHVLALTLSPRPSLPPVARDRAPYHGVRPVVRDGMARWARSAKITSDATRVDVRPWAARRTMRRLSASKHGHGHGHGIFAEKFHLWVPRGRDRRAVLIESQPSAAHDGTSSRARRDVKSGGPVDWMSRVSQVAGARLEARPKRRPAGCHYSFRGSLAAWTPLI